MAKHTKNQTNAVKLLEYLASAPAQDQFANGNNEWPEAKGIQINNPAFQGHGRWQLQE